MSKLDEQLVQQIVEQVFAMMQQQGAASSQPGSAAAPASIHPPIGVCTGDYSKFPELQKKQVGAVSSSPAPASANAPSGASSPLALSGIVTAQQLQDAMKAASDGIATLASGARPTPLASDLIRQYPDRVRKLDSKGQTASHQPATPTGAQASQRAGQLPWLWWADGFCPAVQKLTGSLGASLRPSAAQRSDTGLLELLEDLSLGVASQSLQGGLLFVQSAALANCYANRHPALRAIVGSASEAVEKGIETLGANVLIIEYPYTRPEKLEAMVKQFIAHPPKPPAHVAMQLKRMGGGRR